MATSKGHGQTVRVGANVVGEVQDAEVTLTGQHVEDTCVTDYWQTFQPTVKGGTGRLRAWFDEDDAQQDSLRGTLEGATAQATLADVRVEVNQSGALANKGYYSGTILMDSIRISNPGIPGVVEMECNFTFSGQVSYTDESA